MAQSILPLMLHAGRYIALCVAIGASAQSADQNKTLDLGLVRTTEPAVVVVGGSGTGGGIGGPGSVIQPVKVSIMQVDKSRCRSGEMVIQMGVSNTTDQMIMLPWSPDGEAVVAPHGLAAFPYKHLNISLFEEGTNTQSSAVSLFGTPHSSGSEVSLKPGESVVVRGLRISNPSNDLCAARFSAVVTLYSEELFKDGDNKYRLRSRQLWQAEAHSPSTHKHEVQQERVLDHAMAFPTHLKVPQVPAENCSTTSLADSSGTFPAEFRST
ncbi:MAG TPA: hypothetical protein VN622_00105 [Clostridia bacterium]|nr:hypothetical protein [Clostridia bacterium]